MTLLGPPDRRRGNNMPPSVDEIRIYDTVVVKSSNNSSWVLPPGFALEHTGKTSKLEPRLLKSPVFGGANPPVGWLQRRPTL
jgi:hypothetical protein